MLAPAVLNAPQLITTDNTSIKVAYLKPVFLSWRSGRCSGISNAYSPITLPISLNLFRSVITAGHIVHSAASPIIALITSLAKIWGVALKIRIRASNANPAVTMRPSAIARLRLGPTDSRSVSCCRDLVSEAAIGVRVAIQFR